MTCPKCGGTRLAPAVAGYFRGTCRCRCGQPVRSVETGLRVGFCVLARGHTGRCNHDPLAEDRA